MQSESDVLGCADLSGQPELSRQCNLRRPDLSRRSDLQSDADMRWNGGYLHGICNLCRRNNLSGNSDVRTRSHMCGYSNLWRVCDL